MKLTTANIDLPAGKRDHIVWDTTLRGFGLRIRRLSGDRIGRAWIVQYRANGHGRRMIVGDAEKVTPGAARERARKLLAQVELGADPQHDRQQRRDADAQTLRSIIGNYLDAKTLRPNSMRALRKFFGGSSYLGDLLGMPADRITRKDVASRILAVQKASGVSTACSFRAHVNALFVWAMGAGLIEHNPVIGAIKLKAPPSRDRQLSDPELTAVWHALDDDAYGKIVRLLICCGARREEVAGLSWPEIDLDAGAWTLPKERSKNGMAHTLPITDLMREIIESVPHIDGQDRLFGKFSDWTNGKRALDAQLDLPAWRVHDLRRSVASRMGDIGIMPHIVEEILNHRSGHKRGVAGVYLRSVYEREVRAAMALWSDHIRSIVTGGERKVVAFERAAATA